MGMSRDFLCPACGLAGNVSGGGDCGMMDATTTIYCETCQTLQDAVVVKELYAIPPKEIAPRCEKRKSHRIKLWNREQLCPRCGQAHLQEDTNGTVIMWD
jgi:acetone carboxylase gamma subunit